MVDNATEQRAGLSEGFTERLILSALATEPAGLSTSDLARRLRPGPLSDMPRKEFVDFAVGFGQPLGKLLKAGLIHRGAIHAGWRITAAGRALLRSEGEA